MLFAKNNHINITKDTYGIKIVIIAQKLHLISRKRLIIANNCNIVKNNPYKKTNKRALTPKSSVKIFTPTKQHNIRTNEVIKKGSRVILPDVENILLFIFKAKT